MVPTNHDSKLSGNRRQSHARIARCLRAPALSVLFFLGPVGPLAGQNQAANESQVKAAYLYNFAHSARWPSTGQLGNNAPFVIGVVGDDEGFLDSLVIMVDGRTVDSHPITAKAIRSVAEMRSCQVVFFHTDERKRVPAMIVSLQSAPVLTVGEDSSFLQQGGMINLVLQNGRIRFAVNRQALDRAGISLSPALLQLAKPADTPPAGATAGTRQLRLSDPPVYPELARRAQLKGSVRLEAVVRRDGTVKQVRVLGGSPVLADALARAVMDWQ